jgi:hypothetical protein
MYDTILLNMRCVLTLAESDRSIRSIDWCLSVCVISLNIDRLTTTSAVVTDIL